MTDFTADWPEGADGDVFRRLAAAGFEFTKAWPVEYNVDFESWPPPEAALEQLRALYGEVLLYPPDEEGGGYVLFQVVGPLTYEGVISVQRRTTATMQRSAGCASHGV